MKNNKIQLQLESLQTKYGKYIIYTQSPNKKII